jgi:hypothetical protein
MWLPVSVKNSFILLKNRLRLVIRSNFGGALFWKLKLDISKKTHTKLERITSLILFFKSENLTHHFDTNWASGSRPLQGNLLLSGFACAALSLKHA